MLKRTLLKSLLVAVTAVALPAISMPAAAEDIVKVQMQTSLGNIDLELYKDKAPVTVENFITYIEGGHYNGTIFHRVIKNFMIQGGGYTKDMSMKATLPPIKNEADNGLDNDRGTIAMARRPQKDSATSQFFINTKDNDFLNHGKRDFGYAVFGKVTKGMDVVDAIEAVKTLPGDRPANAVVINKVSVIND